MAHVNDLSRSIVAFQQSTTLVAVIEMGANGWLVAATVPGIERQPLKKLEPDAAPKTALAMVFKLVEAAQRPWRRLDGHNQLPKLILGVKFTNGLEVAAKQTDRQSNAAAA